MGRIITKVKVGNYATPDYSLTINALVDTGAAYLTLPKQWKRDLGDLEVLGEIEVELADQTVRTAEICGPVRAKISNFREVFCEVLFIEMNENEQGDYEPLLGYIPLESVNAGVDMVGHRLIHMKHYDMK